jgi:hypothetical protein
MTTGERLHKSPVWASTPMFVSVEPALTTGAKVPS